MAKTDPTARGAGSRNIGRTARRRAAAIAAVAFLVGGPAHATDWSSGYPAAPAYSNDNYIVAIDTAITATTIGSLFGDASMTLALTGDLQEYSGWRARFQGQIGTYDYVANFQKIQGQQEGGSALVGYEWIERDIHAAAYIGMHYSNNSLNPDDPNNQSRGAGWGVRVIGEIYANPTDYTLATAYVTYSTLHSSYYTRFKLGYALVDRVFIGPEFSFLGDNFFRQWRVGAHITGVTLGRFQFGLSGGYLMDSKRGPGGYVIVDSRVSF